MSKKNSLYSFFTSFVFLEKTLAAIWSNFQDSQDFNFFCKHSQNCFWVGISCKLIHFPKKCFFGTRQSAGTAMVVRNLITFATSSLPFTSGTFLRVALGRLSRGSELLLLAAESPALLSFRAIEILTGSMRSSTDSFRLLSPP